MTPEALQKAVAASEPGNIIEYHRGFLVADRIHNRDVSAVANAAASLAQGGRLLLTQRRVEPGVFAYEATIAEKPGDYWTKPGGEWGSA